MLPLYGHSFNGQGAVRLAGLSLASLISFASSAQLGPKDAWDHVSQGATPPHRVALTWNSRTQFFPVQIGPSQIEAAQSLLARRHIREGTAPKEAATLAGAQLSQYLSRMQAGMCSGVKTVQSDGHSASATEQIHGVAVARSYERKDSIATDILAALRDLRHGQFNPMALEDCLSLEPLALSIHPVSACFGMADVKSCSASTMSLSRLIDTAVAGASELATVDLATGLPTQVQMLLGDKPVVRYSILHTQNVGTVVVPSKVLYEVLRLDGKPQSRTEYILASAVIDGKSAKGLSENPTSDLRLSSGNEAVQRLAGEGEEALLPLTAPSKNLKWLLIPAGLFGAVLLTLGRSIHKHRAL